jgi:hypothetical protein
MVAHEFTSICVAVKYTGTSCIHARSAFSYKPFSILMAYNIRSMVFGKCAKWQENSAYVV